MTERNMQTVANVAIKGSWMLLAGVLVAVIGLCLQQAMSRLWVLAEFDPNEGWNAIIAYLVAQGESVYKTSDGLTRGAYTPLSFYLVAYAGDLVGDHVLAGRTVSVIALFGIGVAIALCLAQMRAKVLAIVFGVLYFFGIMVAFYHRYIAMNDPHLLSQFFLTLGIVVVVGAWRNPIRIVLSLSLLAIALMTKQTLLAAPLAVVLNVFAENRSRPFFVAGACLLVACITLTILYVTIGSAIFEGILHGSKHNMFVWHGIVRTVPNILILQVGGIFALLSCIVTLENVDSRFIFTYLILASVFGMVWSTTFGADINHWFDLLIAISLGLGWGLSRLCTAVEGQILHPTSKFAVAMLPFLLFMQIPTQVALILKSPATYRQEYAQRERLTEDSISYLRRHNGPVLCQNGVLCYWAGYRTIPVPWLGKGTIGEVSAERPDALAHDLVEKIRQKYFEVVQVGIDRKSAEDYHFPSGFFSSLDEYYVLDYKNNSGAFFVRKAAE